MLSAAQVQSYGDEGYIVLPGVLSPQEVSTLQRVTDEFIDRSRHLTATDSVFDLEEGHSAENPRLRRIKEPDEQHPAYGALVRHAGILDILKQLMSPAIRYDKMKLNLKPGNGGEAVEWHQDWAFYPHTNDDLCAVGVMIDDMTPENGPLLVVPGSHKGPILDHHQDGVFVGAVTDPRGDAAFAKAVPLLGKAGDISVHHVRTLHASAVNYSDRHRRLLLLQMRAADAWPLIPATQDFGAYNSLMLVGEASVSPRLTNVPVRLPLPRAVSNKASIFDKQKPLKKSYFGGTQRRMEMAGN